MEKMFVFPNVEVDQILIHKIYDELCPVYIYGVGSFLEEVILFLKEKKVPILGIVDRDARLWGSEKFGIKIENPNEIDNIDTPVIVCSGTNYYDICDTLREKGIYNILPYYFILSGKEMDYREYCEKFQVINHARDQTYIQKNNLQHPFILHSIDLVITECCSLKCESCANLMQYYQKPKHEDLSQQLSALDAVLKAIDYISEIRVLGGEPFVCPELVQYLNHLKQYKNIGAIIILSNGTILPKDDVLKALENEKVYIKLSDYGSLSKKLQLLEEVFVQHKIPYSIEKMEKWTECSSIFNHNRTEEELKQVFTACCAGYTFSLKKGKLYGCPFAANVASLMAVPQSVNEEINTTIPTSELREAIRQMNSRAYSLVCQYCEGRPRGIYDIPAAIQAKEPLVYKRYQ